jgi:SAM-dependent methyltransferase
MSGKNGAARGTGGNFYGSHYSRIDSALAAEIRREAFGVDIGQESWRSASEQGEIADLLGITAESRVLDVACGAGGPSLALVERTGCRLTGLDIQPEGIAHAKALATQRGLAGRADFIALDCGGSLPFEDGSYDAVLCIDSIPHLPNRPLLLKEWGRLLCLGGRLVFTDPFVVTGAIAKVEIDGRSALGSNLFFVPPGLNEEAIAGAGLSLISRRDCAAAQSEIAGRWHAARSARSEKLTLEEGQEWFERRQLMLLTTSELARAKRLTRFLYVAEKTI